MTRHLIIPGLAKAGTSFLFQNLMRQPEIFASTGRKEVNYFGEVRQRGRTAYLTQFPAEERHKILLDASPSYIQNRDDGAERIRTVLARETVTIVILVRDPIETFFSHYLHDLKSTIGRPSWRRPRPARFTLSDPPVLARYLAPRAPSVARYPAVFGQACLGFQMQALFDGTLAARLGEALGVALLPFDSGTVVNRGGFVPRYLYGGDGGLPFEQDGKAYRVPPRALVFVAEERSEIQPYATPEEAAAFHALGESFSREVKLGRAQLQAILDDHEAVCAALGLAPRPRPATDEIRLTAPDARLPERILSRLPVI
jgi:hypothetical protein